MIYFCKHRSKSTKKKVDAILPDWLCFITDNESIISEFLLPSLSLIFNWSSTSYCWQVTDQRSQFYRNLPIFEFWSLPAPLANIKMLVCFCLLLFFLGSFNQENLWNLLLHFLCVCAWVGCKTSRRLRLHKNQVFCIEAVHDMAFLAISWEKIRQWEQWRLFI